LVLVSPNMTYPLLETAKAQQVIDAAPATLAKLEAAAAADADAAAKLPEARASLEANLTSARASLEKFAGQRTSLVGLEKPLIALKNPGLYSIPVGFLFVFLGSLLWRDRRADDMWEELYVRQNTGIHAEEANAH
jgi:cation/acetate symporter